MQSATACHPYRIFISYSRDDRAVVQRLVDRLEAMKMRPIWDRDIRPGDHFPERIKKEIGRAHVFVALLTENSALRPWVHQETGYALGMGVPIVPIAIGQVPDQMLSDLQAVTTRDDFEDLRAEWFVTAVEKIMSKVDRELRPTYLCAETHEMRAQLLGDYTRELLQEENVEPLRQQGALSSFNLPDAPYQDPIWVERDGGASRGVYLYERLAEERSAFQDYARANGCRLVIDPTSLRGTYSPAARRIRLATLLEFLADMSVPDVRVAVRKRELPGSLTLVGDWFCADSVTPRGRKGYQHTNFTWHAATVLKKLRQFDRDFAWILKRAGVAPEASRDAAIRAVEEEIALAEAEFAGGAG